MSVAGTLGLASYRLAGHLAGPIVRHKLRRRAKVGKEDPKRIGERFGHTSAARPDGPLLWIHAASVGESLAALPLIESIHALHEEIHFLLTTGTVTSANLLKTQLPPYVNHQYAPVDLPAVARRFLDHWKPDAALLLESEFWPNMLLGLDRRGIPRALVNGRVSPESYARWSSLRPVIADLLAGFHVCLAQTQRDAEFLRDLGAGHVVTTGNIKEAAGPLIVDEQELNVACAAAGDRPLWLAASTHPGEEVAVARVHFDLCRRFPDILTIIVPRHPDRGLDIQIAIQELGLVVARRSQGEKLGPTTAVYIADTLGELGLWYRLCPVVFVGKSLVGKGGQNPLEAARLGCALLFGPFMSNFEQISADLVGCGAAQRVQDEGDLRVVVAALLDDREIPLSMARAGLDYTAARGQALETTMTHLDPILGGIMDRYARVANAPV
ncbi:MAG: 3-deoxy-D-manno-octulosonic acid transferase [Alphaproteobacteria bacterium]|nr:3-deoxy-D-manno-octulosonic acid transferase [Alphaproteobacteria bacterium]